MAVLNVTLDSLKFANTDGFFRDFGTKKTRDQNGGSLTTRECNENVAKIFDTQRPFYVSEDSETSNIEFSATFVISNGVKLTLGEGSFPGVEVKILSGDNSAVIAGQKEYILPINGFTKFFWTGTSWNYTSFSTTQTSVQSINPNDEFPIMQDGETKKVKFETLRNKWLGDDAARLTIYTATMRSLGVPHGGYISVRDFWATLRNKYGYTGMISFPWAYADSAFLGSSSSSIHISGGFLFFVADDVTTWRTFNALYVASISTEIYHIQTSISEDINNDSWSIVRLD